MNPFQLLLARFLNLCDANYHESDVNILGIHTLP